MTIETIQKIEKELAGLNVSGLSTETKEVVEKLQNAIQVWRIEHGCPAERPVSDDELSDDTSSSGGDPIIDEYVERGADVGEHILGIPGMLIGGFIAGGVGMFKSLAEDRKAEEREEFKKNPFYESVLKVRYETYIQDLNEEQRKPAEEPEAVDAG